MATKIEAARQLVYTTAWRFQNGEYPVREISMAKLYAARVAVEVADECIQIHGGAGYMKEYGVERVWRDMRLNRIGAGTDEIMLDVIGRSYGLCRAGRPAPATAPTRSSDESTASKSPSGGRRPDRVQRPALSRGRGGDLRLVVLTPATKSWRGRRRARRRCRRRGPAKPCRRCRPSPAAHAPPGWRSSG